jgi:5'-AMP-activated protein kinase regulatory beta subunit
MGSHGSKLMEYNNERGINFMREDSSDSSTGHAPPTPIDRENIVNTTFTWFLGGTEVFLTGSFTKWRTHYPLTRQGHEFSVTVALPKGIYQYKFIVDGEWRFNPDEPTESDEQGNINNVINTTHYQQIDKRSLDHSNYHEELIEKTEKYSDQAVELPVYVRSCTYLNTLRGKAHALERSNLTPEAIREMLESGASLEEPLHVQLNHSILLSRPIPGVTTLAMTQRFKDSYTTFIYYTPQLEA